MTTQLTLRSVKGSPLTNDEMDTNWVNLRSTADSALTAANSANAAMPTATATTTGGIKVGSGLSIDGAGVLSASGSGGSYTLPVASSTTLGGIKIGSGLVIDGAGVISATATTGPTGPQGPIGNTGPTGPQGPTGPDGTISTANNAIGSFALCAGDLTQYSYGAVVDLTQLTIYSGGLFTAANNVLSGTWVCRGYITHTSQSFLIQRTA